MGTIIVKWRKFETTRSLAGTDRPGKPSNWSTRTLVREVTQNPMTTLTDLQNTSVEIGEPVGRTGVLSQKYSIRQAFMVAWLGT